MKHAVVLGAEGVVVKLAGSPYLAGTRTYNWMGLKHGFFETELADSFDLVVVGVIPGTGNRGNMFGSFLLASVSRDGRFDLVTKCGQGFTL